MQTNKDCSRWQKFIQITRDALNYFSRANKYALGVYQKRDTDRLAEEADKAWKDRNKTENLQDIFGLPDTPEW